jgi:serine/threonine protein kinase
VLIELGASRTPVRACLGDFGTSKEATSTLLDTRVGTPRFMAPEVLRSSQYDGRSADVFSAGLVIFELLSGLPITRATFRDDEGEGLEFPSGLRSALLEQESASIAVLVGLDGESYLLRNCTDRRPSRRPTIDEVRRRVFPTLAGDDEADA